jgi:hypothetical protein
MEGRFLNFGIQPVRREVSLIIVGTVKGLKGIKSLRHPRIEYGEDHRVAPDYRSVWHVIFHYRGLTF